GRIIRALASEGNRPAAYMLARKQFGENSQVTKALETGSTGGGGALIAQDLLGEVVELLRPRSVVRRAGAITMDCPWGTKTVPRLASSATASYVAENADIPASEPGFDTDEIELKKLACLVPLSNELVSFTSTVGRADEIVRDDMVQELGQTEDREFLIGDGASGGPEGLTTQALAAHTDSATSDEEATLRTAVNHLEQANVPGERLGWVMSPRTFNYLFTQRGTNGNLKFPELRNDVPTLWNFPVYKTSAIPNDGGSGTNESQIIFSDFSQVVVAEALGMRVDVTQDGAYLDSGSTMRSAFTRDQTIIRAIRHHALYLRHPEAVAVVDAVTWGA
ncbi:phage major capsid protein, partial [Aquisalimonas lutea]|uniref:phage major capsid protein n=1 Tax=Aquisalimonas lutea TaxID=1327750 RepID=UPI0025B60285